MKYSLLIFSALLSCSAPAEKSPTDRAKDSVSAYVKRITNDPASYEQIEFGSLDSNITEIEGTSEFVSLDSDSSFMERRLGMTDIYDKDETIKKLDSIKAALITYRQNFKSEFRGYTMEHSFRAKNAMGALVIGKNIFWLDSNLSVFKVEKD